MITGLALGAGIGIGIYLVGRALLLRRVPLAVALADLERPRSSMARRAEAERSWEQRIGARSAVVLEGLGVDLDRSRCDRRVLERTMERHVVEKLTAAVVGFGAPVVMAAVAAAGGVDVPFGLVALTGLCFGAAGFLLPDLLLPRCGAGPPGRVPQRPVGLPGPRQRPAGRGGRHRDGAGRGRRRR